MWTNPRTILYRKRKRELAAKMAARQADADRTRPTGIEPPFQLHYARARIPRIVEWIGDISKEKVNWKKEGF